MSSLPGIALLDINNQRILPAFDRQTLFYPNGSCIARGESIFVKDAGLLEVGVAIVDTSCLHTRSWWQVHRPFWISVWLGCFGRPHGQRTRKVSPKVRLGRVDHLPLILDSLPRVFVQDHLGDFLSGVNLLE